MIHICIIQTFLQKIVTEEINNFHTYLDIQALKIYHMHKNTTNMHFKLTIPHIHTHTHAHTYILLDIISKGWTQLKNLSAPSWHMAHLKKIYMSAAKKCFNHWANNGCKSVWHRIKYFPQRVFTRLRELFIKNSF